MTFVAERMTIRASHSVAVAGAYLRLFVEPHVDGLDFQRRMASPLRDVKAVGSSARSFAVAYVGLTAAFLLAWIAAPVQGDRLWWQTLLIGVLGTASALQVAELIAISRFRWDAARPWRKIHEDEERSSTLDAVSAPRCEPPASSDLRPIPPAKSSE